MKANEIKVGGIYRARISGNLVNVRVDNIREVTKRGRSTDYSGLPNYVDGVVYEVTNLTTGRSTTFKTAGKFRCEVKRKPESVRLERAIHQLSDEAHRGVITKEQHDVAFDKLLKDEADARGVQLPQVAVEVIIGRELADGVTPMPSDLEGLSQALSEGL